MDATAIGERSSTADSSNADLNGNTVEPSELVPSGNSTTTEPAAIARAMTSTLLRARNLWSRSTNTVPAACASQPNKGQLATSRLATNTHGRIELKITKSR